MGTPGNEAAWPRWINRRTRATFRGETYGDQCMARLFGRGDSHTEETFNVQHTEEEWKQLLNPPQFQVLRKHGTERAGTSPLNQEKRPGIFVCAGCERD